MGEWRAVSINLQLDAKSVLLNDSALAAPGGAVLQLPHVRELQLLCMKSDRPVGPTPSNVQEMLFGLRVVGCGACGSLPAELAGARQLNSLVLSHNKLTGSLPEQLLQLQALLLLDLSHNALSGTLPRQWGSLGALSYLYLNANNLSLDELPCEWGRGMVSLKLADLSGNRTQATSVTMGAPT
ncbi:hypothetical protein OEZ86_009814 [Tetradesmus obliquus]|uniref:Leucine-rich repeat-containing N-terminal plant-type domain-containing protein n=1 Tax=Tetradesmus obliquus TaxID=3088 RepID=A0ABY8UQC1_TETOB|nr:hypothetical protein OEZ85_001255 [Tetradesmus obliquus]WIA43315.1 hypothetical protein OEZ86_009814 [Tetradesmus obliquus]